MARPVTNLHELEGAVKLTKYAELHELVKNFAQGKLQCLALVAPPGLGKSETILRAIEGKNALYVRGYMTPLKLFIKCQKAVDRPIILDDTETMFQSGQVREMLTALTETKKSRVMEWTSATKLLEDAGVESKFVTSSPVTVIRNCWDTSDPLLQALASRAEFATFLPPWEEVYRHLASWFWDQEILDLVWKNLGTLRQPDIRIVMKAWQRKVTKNRLMTWERAILDHLANDSAEVAARELIHDTKLKSDNKRGEIWVAAGHGSRATWFRLVKKLRSFMPAKAVPRLKAQGKPPSSGGLGECLNVPTAEPTDTP